MTKLPTKLLTFLKRNELDDYKIIPLTGDASDRKYFRLSKGSETFILMDSSKVNTWESYLAVADYLSKNKLSAPEIYYKDFDNGYIVLEDLGEHTINELLDSYINNKSEIYENVIDLLVSFTKLQRPPVPDFDNKFFTSELKFFTDFYLKYIGSNSNKTNLEGFFNSWNMPLEYIYKNDPHDTFVHKDFHSANLFWLPQRDGVRRIGLIDFQAAKSGSIVYDITSVLCDCRMPLPLEFRDNLSKSFLAKTKIDASTYKNLCDTYIAQRNIKILGNFAYIHMQKDNNSYLRFIPNAKMYISEAVKNPLLKELKLWLVDNRIL